MQEAKIREAARHIFDADGNEINIAAWLKLSDELSNMDILAAAFAETREALADPSHDVTAARERFALSKGVKLDSQLTERLKDLFKELDRDIHTSSSAFERATTRDDKMRIMLEKMALLELREFGKGKNKESKPATEGPDTSKVKSKEGGVHAEGSSISQGRAEENGTGKSKGQKNKPALDDTANGKDVGKEPDMLVEGSTIDKGKEKQIKVIMEGPTTEKGKRKGKKVTGKDKRMEHDMLVEDSTNNKGKEKEGEGVIDGPPKGKGKTKDKDLPPADGKSEIMESGHDEAETGQVDSDLLREAKALFLGSNADKFYEAVLFLLSAEQGSTVSDVHIDESRVLEVSENALLKFIKLRNLMERAIRTQTASPAQGVHCCRIFSDPHFFAVLSPVIEELRWNREVVEHPDNPMISCILRCTKNLRPTDGLHHPSGTSVAPLLVPQYPPLPPGPVPATPAVTTHMQKAHKRERPGTFKLKDAPIYIEIPFEDAMKALDLREALIVAKMKTGLTQPVAEAFADLMAVAYSKGYLKEKARLEDAGGKTADRLAQRLKKMAEDDGVPSYLIP